VGGSTIEPGDDDVSQPVIRTAGRADLGRLVEILSAAFAEDPVVTWMIGAERATPARRRSFFRTLVGHHPLPLGGCDLTEHGAAVWLPPGQLSVPSIRQLRQFPGLVRTFGPRLRAAAEADELMRSHRPSVPHWYLQFIGVEPGCTGRGIGASLLRHRLALIDTEPAPAYLESSQRANVPLYQRHGFQVIDEVRFAPDAPLEFLMLRPAAGPGGT
jgi:ribosomal protein S18 acetylase RimI-like enzyme